MTIAAPPTTAPATAPSTHNASRTNHELLKEIAEFDKKYVVDAYEKQGHRDPKWDADATKLIRAQYEASIFINDLGGYYTPTDWPQPMPADDRAALAERVLGAGCDDAMVLYMAGCALEGSSADRSRCAYAYHLADDQAAYSPYIPFYKMLMVHAAVMHGPFVSEGEPELKTFRERFRPLLKAALADHETLPKYRAVIWHKANWSFDSKDQAMADRLGPVVAEVKDADPWILETYLGNVEIQRAWKDRGSGWSNTVTQAGWQGFAEHLELAREHLEHAAKIDPTLPHPAACLVTVCMGQGHPRYRVLVSRSDEAADRL